MLPNWLKQRAFLTPNRVALEIENQKITFQQLHEQVVEMAERITSLKVKKGDTVAVHMKNSLEMILVIHALKYIGAITLLMNTRLSEEEIMWQLCDAKPLFLISDEPLENISYKQHTMIEIKNRDVIPTKIQENFYEDDIDTILYTSGTTGHPKGVMLTYGNHYHSAVASALNLGLHQDDCWLACLPFFHVSGLSILVKNVVYGMRVVVENNLQPATLNQALREKGVTIASVVFKVAREMVEELEEVYPENFRCMLLGGGPAPISFLDECTKRQVPIYQTYGMTETASQIVTLSPEYAKEKVGSAGKALFPCQIKIIKDGLDADINEAGEIVVTGPNVTKGYYNRESDSIIAGWLYTGDMGYMDEDGFLYVLDRRKDMFISGGENIYPAQIEGILLSHPNIEDAGVIGAHHEDWGKVPVAFVVAQGLTEEQIIAFAYGKLASYKTPKKVIFVKELPRNASKKLLRRVLQEWWDNHEHQENNFTYDEHEAEDSISNKLWNIYR